MRYLSSNWKIYNIDPTCSGAVLSDKHYTEGYKPTEKAVQDGIWLRTLSYKNYLANLVETNAMTYAERDDYKTSYRLIEKAFSLDPRYSFGWVCLVGFYEKKSAQTTGPISDKYHWMADQLRKKLSLYEILL